MEITNLKLKFSQNYFLVLLLFLMLVLNIVNANNIAERIPYNAQKLTITVVDTNNTCTIYLNKIDYNRDTIYYANSILTTDSGFRTIYSRYLEKKMTNADYMDEDTLINLTKEEIIRLILAKCPNTPSDSINSSEYKAKIFYLYTFDGKLKLERTIQQEKTVIDISEFPRGIYFVKYRANNKAAFASFSKN